MKPQCTDPRCRQYLLPCLVTANGIHPVVKDATTGKLVAVNGKAA